MIDGIQRVGVGADLNLRGARRRGSLIAGSTLLILCGQEETNGVLPKVDRLVPGSRTSCHGLPQQKLRTSENGRL